MIYWKKRNVWANASLLCKLIFVDKKNDWTITLCYFKYFQILFLFKSFFLLFRRYSQQRCARCHVGLSAHELVMRARDCIYHIDCFLCFSCNKPLRTGDTYGIHCDQVFCQEDYEHLLNNFNTDTSYCNEYSTNFPGNIGDMLTLCGEPMSKGRSRKRKHLLAPDGCLQLGMHTIFYRFHLYQWTYLVCN
jgi:hypothetical protein